MLRVVFDTNLYVSSVLVKAGLPAQAINAWRTGQFILLTSPNIMDEIGATLSYDRIRRKYSLTEEDITALLDLLKAEAVLVSRNNKVVGSIPDDPDDEIILACAVEGQADLIVSGDRHLLSLGEFRDMPIQTVRQFLDRLTETSSGKG